MKTLKNLGLISLIVLSFTSCEKEVNIDVKGEGTKLVVQGRIERQTDAATGDEQGLPPIIVLTKSISFFGDVDSATLAEIFIHDAEVYVSDGTNEVKLVEYDFRFAPGTAIESAYFYSLDTANPGAFMLGEYGKTYTLRVEWNNQTYTSSTTLDAPVPIDSLWQQDATVPQNDTVYQEVRAQYTDPASKGQNYYYQVYSKLSDGGEGDYDDYFNDEVVNGVSIKFTLYSSEQFSDDTTNNYRYGYFLPGDTVVVNWSQIDYASYQFINTKSFSEGSIGNPFGTPINVLGNVSNGALGAFIGYGTYIYQYNIQ